MWKCSTKDGKSCCCSPKITVLLGGLVLIALASAWLMAETRDSMDQAIASPMIESDKTLIGITTATSHLSEADHKAALAQGKCPVMGTVFDEKSKPIKLNYEGREVFVCCPACVAMFKANPDRYLANLQGTCPVSGVVLSTIEKPVKINYEGQSFYVRCAKCEKEFFASPDKFLKNLSDILKLPGRSSIDQ